MPLKFLIDILTGNLVLVNIKPAPASGTTGQSIGLLLAITHTS